MLSNTWQFGTRSQVNNCPQARRNPKTGMVELRDSDRPNEVVQFTPEAWMGLKGSFADGAFDVA